jgi:tetratricopeptide (TPR) repeat protein
MSAVSPAKLKAHLSAIKERFLDNSSPPNTLADAYFGILKIELLLRGVLVDDDEKIWSKIQSSVGKSLLVEQSSTSKIPKALLAGANVMAGRVTEAFYTKLTTSISLPIDRSVNGVNSFDLLRVFVPPEKSLGARQRAEDLQDERWLFLLLSNSQSHDSNEIGIGNYTNGILQMALGYYSTATSIVSDTPQMWKKVWDVWSLLGTADSLDDNDPNDDRPPYEAQGAIENLTRIALLKNNTKRASELQLRLVQAYLNPKRISLVGLLSVLPKMQQAGVVSDTIAHSFGEASAQDLQSNQDKTKGIIISAEKGRLTLEACQSYFEKETKTQEGENSPGMIDPEKILYQTLKVETLLAQENAKVQNEAQETNKRSMTPITLTDCTVQCRTLMVISSYNDGDKIFFEQAIILRDIMITGWRSAATFLNTEKQKDGLESVGKIKNLKLCSRMVNQSILRLKERAEVIGRTKSSNYGPWNELLQFILPILNEVERQIEHLGTTFALDGECMPRAPLTMKWINETLGENGDTHINGDTCSTLKVVTTVVSILPTVLWMTFGDEIPIIHPLNKEFNLVVDVLSGLIKWQERVGLRQQRKDTLTVGSKESTALSSTLQWQHARASVLCFVCQDDNSSIYQITSDAIATSKKEKKRGFLALLQCLVAWSGWFQNPWPYCTNLGDARRLLASAESDLARPLTFLEGILLQLAKADAEFLNGGFVQRAYEHFTNVLHKLHDEELSIDNHSAMLLRAHCYNGMTRVQHTAQDYTDYNNVEKSHTRKSLEILEKLDLLREIPSLWIWNQRSTFVASKAHELSATRQLIANSLVHFGRFEEARSFLQKGAIDSPLDADAALAFGAFLLRLAFYINKEQSAEEIKRAQIHLLKAAKLDSSKSNPFALLGIWYEATGDLRRSQGCFRKSLKLDPCNPIAGRGLLRLCTSSDYQDILDFAINQSSPLNGWAWNAVGLNKAYCDGDDGLAVVAILKALRCRDVALVNKESLGVFYQTPSSFKDINELSAALSEVGMCYRRLGRMTASIRAFRASIEAADARSVRSTTLLSCAQVEHELGLFDEAAGKFESVIERGENASRSIALYGKAMALFSIAERELTDGKAGAAFTCIQRAINSCEDSSIVSGCQSKLLGDLYSFGASFSSDVFSDSENQNQDPDLCFQNQLKFVSKGEAAFRLSLSAQAPFLAKDDESIAIKSSILCDIALNILLQAQLLSSQQINTKKIRDKYDLAAEGFRDAIEYNPIHAASWCGLGCSVLKIDPLLAQHAFCRCIQIENMFPDAYANVGFLYTSKFAFNASRSMMEALTQVADTPMMWMNCAFILEREAEKSLVRDNGGKTEDFISQAADAYRASLQVMRHPEAQLGLSLTGRVTHSDRQKENIPFARLFTQKRKDSFSFMNEYIGASFHKIGAPPVFHGVMSIEIGESIPSERSWKYDILAKGKVAAKTSHAQENHIGVSMNNSSIQNLRASTEKLLRGENIKQSSFPLMTKERSLQRQIWLEPDNGDLWLSLAKSFIKKDSIESAKTAASRAANILSRDLVASSQNNGKTLFFVDAKIISEATSLRCWLNAIQATSVAPYDMQRALMMDPTNRVARNSLLCKGN